MAVSARADLIGTSVTGQMLINDISPNYFESANGFVPPSYGNSGGGTNTTVTIGSGIEFGYADTLHNDTANFTGTGVTLQEAAVGDTASVTYVFTDTAFAGLTLGLTSDDFASAVTASLAGDVLTLTAPDFYGMGVYNAVYTLTASTPAVPESSSVVLLLTVLFAAAYATRKRFARQDS